MRVQGNNAPDTVAVETYLPRKGYVEVRVRENVKQITETDPTTGLEYCPYEYDEYVFHIPEREGLKEEIESNLSDWLATGRVLEVNEGASLVADMKDALNILGVSE